MASDFSIPPSDRADLADAPEQPRERRSAIVIRLPNGSYFRAFRPNGSAVEMRELRRAKLFDPTSAKAIAAMLAKLRRKGLYAVEVNVDIVIGANSTART